MSKSPSKKKEPQSLGRKYLEQQLQKLGYSRRGSVAILDEIFGTMKAALARGEQVEFPLGKLKVARHKHPTQSGRFLNRKKMTIYKKPFTVVHQMSRKVDRCLTSPPIVLSPKPGSPPGAKPIVIDPWKLLLEGKIKLPPKPWLQPSKGPIEVSSKTSTWLRAGK